MNQNKRLERLYFSPKITIVGVCEEWQYHPFCGRMSETIDVSRAIQFVSQVSWIPRLPTYIQHCSAEIEMKVINFMDLIKGKMRT